MPKTKGIFEVFVFSASLLLAFFTFNIFSPIIIANAGEDTAQVSVDVGTVISVTTSSDTIVFDVMPSSEGTFMKKSLSANVSTNATDGYELYFSSVDNETDMVSETTDSKIKSDFSGSVTDSTMGKNKWGYSLDSTNFNAIPKSNSAAKIKDLNHLPTSAEKSTAIEIGTKIDATMMSGSYTKTVVFSAVAHETSQRVFGNIYTMQEMTSSICSAETTPSPAATVATYIHRESTDYIPMRELTDVRDGTKYLVGKYADGNCWMANPLEIILTTSNELNSETTDLNSKQTYKIDYDTYVFNGSGTGPAFPADGKSRAINMKSASSIVFYNWYAAMAGGKNVEDSICPKGWRLPSSGYDDAKSFGPFLSSYGIEDSAAHINAMASATYSPLKLYGFYSTSSRKLVYNGTEGRYWLRGSSGVNGYNFYFSNNMRVDNTYRNTLDLSNKAYGFAVTCVAR